MIPAQPNTFADYRSNIVQGPKYRLAVIAYDDDGYALVHPDGYEAGFDGSFARLVRADAPGALRSTHYLSHITIDSDKHAAVEAADWQAELDADALTRP